MENSVGQYIKQARTNKGMSQADVAKDICSIATISNIENGKLIPKAATLIKLAQKLEFDPSRFLNISQDMTFDLEIANALILKGDFLTAKELIDKCAEQEMLEYQKVEFVKVKSNLLYCTKMYHECIEFLKNEFFPISSKGDITFNVDCYNRLGNAYYYTSDYLNAYTYYDHAAKFCADLHGNDILVVKTTYNQANICRKLGFNDKAIVLLNTVREYFEKNENPQKRADTAFSLAIAYREVGNLELFTKHIKEAAQLYEGLDNQYLSKMAQEKYAFHILSKVDANESKKQLENIADYFLRHSDLQMAAFVFARIAYLNIETSYGHEMISKAYIYYPDCVGTPKQAYLDSVLAKMHFLQKNYADAIMLAKKSAETYESFGMQHDAITSLNIAVHAYQATGELNKALELSMSSNAKLLQSR